MGMEDIDMKNPDTDTLTVEIDEHGDVQATAAQAGRYPILRDGVDGDRHYRALEYIGWTVLDADGTAILTPPSMRYQGSCDDGGIWEQDTADLDPEDWRSGEETMTTWVTVYLLDTWTGEAVSKRVTIDPVEPDCTRGDDHSWRAWPPGDEHGGVRGHGGSVIVTEACQHCGAYRLTDYWAQDPMTGEQGLESIEYRPADAESEPCA